MKKRYICRMALVSIVFAGLAAVVIWIDPAGLFTVKPVGFSRRGWKTIEQGNDRSMVIQNIGEPFMKADIPWSDEIGEVWYYSKKRSPHFLFKDCRVYFDKNGRVSSKASLVSEDCKVSRREKEVGCASRPSCPKEQSVHVAMAVLEDPCGEDTLERIKEMADVDALRVIAYAARAAAWSMEAGPDKDFDHVLMEMSLAAVHRLFVLDSPQAREAIKGYKSAFPPDGAISLLFSECEKEMEGRGLEGRGQSL